MPGISAGVSPGRIHRVRRPVALPAAPPADHTACRRDGHTAFGVGGLPTLPAGNASHAGRSSRYLCQTSGISCRCINRERYRKPLRKRQPRLGKRRLSRIACVRRDSARSCRRSFQIDPAIHASPSQGHGANCESDSRRVVLRVPLPMWRGATSDVGASRRSLNGNRADTFRLPRLRPAECGA